jgi:peroxiredoxin
MKVRDRVTRVAVPGALAGAAYVLYHVIRQQGRLLLRIEELERMLGVPGAHGVHSGHAHAGAASSTPVGLPVGATVDPVTLPDLDGNDVSLGDFRGRQVVLVNWSPTCGFCDAIAADLAAAGRDLEQKANATLVFVAHGTPEANRAMAEKYAIASPVLLLGDEANPAGFRNLGTPSAFLIDAEGRAATTLAVGADQVPVLVHDVIDAATPGDGEDGQGTAKKLRGQRNLSESRLVRDGLKAGTPAPPFTLPDLEGTPVSLEDYRGRRVLLAFSDPDCGPCEALVPHLSRISREHEGNDLAVVMVGRGDVETNRKKAQEQGYRFPVVLQDGWKLSREYGIFATPVAFLIDEQGTITRDVARGVDEIVALMDGA